MSSDTLSGIFDKAFLDGDSVSLAVVQRLTELSAECAPHSGDEIMLVMSGVRAIPPSWDARDEASIVLLSVGKPFISESGEALVTSTWAGFEEAKNCARSNAHRVLASRKRKALKDAIEMYHGAAAGSSNIDQGNAVGKTIEALDMLCLAEGGISVAAPLLTSIALTFDTALMLSADGKLQACLDASTQRAPPSVSLLLDDAAVLEVGPPQLVRDLVAWMALGLGLVPDSETMGSSPQNSPGDPVASGAAAAPGLATEYASMRAWRLLGDASDTTLACVTIVILRALGAGSKQSTGHRTAHSSGKGKQSSKDACHCTSKQNGPMFPGLSCTTHRSWQCFPHGPDSMPWRLTSVPAGSASVEAAHIEHQLSALPAGSSEGGSSHAYSPHVLSHRAVGGTRGTLAALERECAVLRPPTANAKDAASKRSPEVLNVAAPGVVTLCGRRDPATGGLIVITRPNADGQLDRNVLRVPLGDGTKPAAGAASREASSSWCPLRLGIMGM